MVNVKWLQGLRILAGLRKHELDKDGNGVRKSQRE